MPDFKTEPSIKNKQAINVSKKMGRRYSLLDAMMMGRRLGINWKKEKFSVGDLLVGMHYELEHGKVDPETNVTDDSPKKTAKVAWAHLKERPDYYVQLMKIDPPHKLEKKASIVLNNMVKLASQKDKEDEAEKEKTAFAYLDEMVKEADLNFSQTYVPRNNPGQFASEAQKRSDRFVSSLKNNRSSIERPTDDYLKDVAENARRATYDKATTYGSPEYKAVRNRKLVEDKVNRKTENARAKINTMYEDALKSTDYDKPKSSGLGNKALMAAGLTAAGVGAYKAYKKHKEKKQAQQGAIYSQYPQYPQLMQQTASLSLDNLYAEKLAADNVNDDIPDLVSEVKYKPEIKKEETPGGKITPSRYVQRKNKQRYNA